MTSYNTKRPRHWPPVRVIRRSTPIAKGQWIRRNIHINTSSTFHIGYFICVWKWYSPDSIIMCQWFMSSITLAVCKHATCPMLSQLFVKLINKHGLMNTNTAITIWPGSAVTWCNIARYIVRITQRQIMNQCWRSFHKMPSISTDADIASVFMSQRVFSEILKPYQAHISHNAPYRTEMSTFVLNSALWYIGQARNLVTTITGYWIINQTYSATLQLTETQWRKHGMSIVALEAFSPSYHYKW